MNDTLELRAWIAHVFDHPVTDPEWYGSEDAPEWHGAPEDVTALLAETFEHGGELLSRFSDEQLDQGFWFLLCSIRGEDFTLTLVDEKIPIAKRLRALRSFVPLFETVMATRCSSHLSHLGEEGARPLNSDCYMWWDILDIRGCPEDPSRAEFDAEVLLTLRRLLAIPHDACRESALHGVGHWVGSYPQLAEVVDEFLSNIRGLRPELVAYAECARAGNVQ